MYTLTAIILTSQLSRSDRQFLTGTNILLIEVSLRLALADMQSIGMSRTTVQEVIHSSTLSDENYRNANEKLDTGDGVTDDTAAINAAISAGGRCGQGCASSTTTPGSIYFPSGTYLISSSIIDQYYTNLIGNPNDLPVLKATRDFSGFGLIDGDKYYGADLNWASTTVFWRQVRNFVLDMTNIPSGSAATGMHWPTAQATSIQNVEFRMSAASGTQHIGLFVESGETVFFTYPGSHVSPQG